MEKASVVMNRIGKGLLKQSEDKSSDRKDLLSVLAQVNTREMNEEDVMYRAYNPLRSGVFTNVLSEFSTFVAAGHETTR